MRDTSANFDISGRSTVSGDEEGAVREKRTNPSNEVWWSANRDKTSKQNIMGYRVESAAEIKEDYGKRKTISQGRIDVSEKSEEMIASALARPKASLGGREIVNTHKEIKQALVNNAFKETRDRGSNTKEAIATGLIFAASFTFMKRNTLGTLPV